MTKVRSRRQWTPAHSTAVAAGLGVAGVVLFLREAAALPAMGPGATNGVTGYLGVDYDFHIQAANRWLRGDGLYLDFQLAGSYNVARDGGFLYPPTIVYLLVPFTVLPPILWWAVPVGLLATAVLRLRPAPAAWVAMGLLALLPQVHEPYLYGNPVMWIAAALAWGLVIGWPGVLVLLKPSLAPFALAGVRSRQWWVALGILAAASVPLFALWSDWFVSLANSDGSLTYSIRQVPLLLIPVVAWAGRSRVPDQNPGEDPYAVNQVLR